MKLFSRSISPQCAYCARGVPLGEDRVLCKKKGITAPEDACGRFLYDPLQRVPPVQALPDFSQLDPQDFHL